MLDEGIVHMLNVMWILCERMQEIRKQMQHPVGGKIFWFFAWICWVWIAMLISIVFMGILCNVVGVWFVLNLGVREFPEHSLWEPNLLIDLSPGQSHLTKPVIRPKNMTQLADPRQIHFTFLPEIKPSKSHCHESESSENKLPPNSHLDKDHK